MNKEKQICPVKDCNEEATIEFGPLLICEKHFNECAYDMKPLILKSNSKQEADNDKEQ